MPPDTTGLCDGTMDDAFDSLAKLAAEGRLSRRQLVRRAVGLAVAVWLAPWLGRIGAARAGVVGKVGDCPAQPAGSCSAATMPYSATCAQKVANGTTSSYNGCGPEAGIDLRQIFDHFGVPHSQLEPPDNPLWLGNFVDACNGHDCCYGTCGSDKAQCDDAFRSGLHAACNQAHPNPGILGTALAFYCNEIAEQYYKAVAQGGDAAFQSGQAEVCDCCCDGTCNPPCSDGETCNTQTCECVVPV